MKVIDFVVGKTYLIKEKDITFPDGEIEGGPKHNQKNIEACRPEQFMC